MRLLFIGLLSSVLMIGSSAELAEASRAYAEGNYRAAARTWKVALRKYPNYAPQINYNLGLCYQALDSSKLAMQCFQRAVSQEDAVTTSRAYTHQAVALAANDKVPGALRLLRKALLLAPANEAARYNYEVLMHKSGQDTPPPPKQNAPNQPPPPDQNPREKREQYMERVEAELRRMLGRVPSDAALPNGMDTLSLPEAVRVVEELREKELQYQQQLRKAAPPADPAAGGKPVW
jgi:tetratricopeptide (TPR) repeat protein